MAKKGSGAARRVPSAPSVLLPDGLRYAKSRDRVALTAVTPAPV